MTPFLACAPWSWLLWWVAVAVLLFVGTAAYSGARDSARRHRDERDG